MKTCKRVVPARLHEVESKSKQIVQKTNVKSLLLFVYPHVGYD